MNHNIKVTEITPKFKRIQVKADGLLKLHEVNGFAEALLVQTVRSKEFTSDDYPPICGLQIVYLDNTVEDLAIQFHKASYFGYGFFITNVGIVACNLACL